MVDLAASIGSGLTRRIVEFANRIDLRWWSKRGNASGFACFHAEACEQIVIDPEEFVHLAFVGFLIFVAAKVEPKFIDDLRPLADPIVPSLVGDVFLNPRTDGALERGAARVRFHSCRFDGR